VSSTVNHIRPRRNTAFFHQDSKFDGNDDRTLNKKIVHHIYNGYRYLTIVQSPKRHLSSSSLIPPVSVTACRLRSDCDRAPRNALLTEKKPGLCELKTKYGDSLDQKTDCRLNKSSTYYSGNMSEKINNLDQV